MSFGFCTAEVRDSNALGSTLGVFREFFCGMPSGEPYESVPAFGAEAGGLAFDEALVGLGYDGGRVHPAARRHRRIDCACGGARLAWLLLVLPERDGGSCTGS